MDGASTPDEDGDGYREVHAQHGRGLRSLLAVPGCGRTAASRRRRPAYLGFFQLVHNARRRGKALLSTSSAACSHRPILTTPEPDKSLR